MRLDFGLNFFYRKVLKSLQKRQNKSQTSLPNPRRAILNIQKIVEDEILRIAKVMPSSKK
jgi:hypothetical protein